MKLDMRPQIKWKSHIHVRGAKRDLFTAYGSRKWSTIAKAHDSLFAFVKFHAGCGCVSIRER